MSVVGTHSASRSRRASLGLLAGVAFGALASLSGCGFKLRGAGVQMPFSRLLLEGVPSQPLVRQLSAQLQGSGVEVLRAQAPAGMPAAEVVLHVLQDQRERVVVGTTATGQVRELQLRHRLRVRLRSARGRDLIADTELLQERELSFTEAQVLGKEEEEALLFDDMRSSIVRQLMARLAAVRLP